MVVAVAVSDGGTVFVGVGVNVAVNEEMSSLKSEEVLEDVDEVENEEEKAEDRKVLVTFFGGSVGPMRCGLVDKGVFDERRLRRR